jgi:pimeloyl-ACP methyl ester carboxylesterase
MGRAQEDGRVSGGALAAMGLAAAAAGTAALVSRSARRAERAFPPIGRRIAVDGAGVHYLEAGAGEPVVLLHGNGSLLQDFVLSGLFDLLARRRRVIAIDRPGYGYSERPGRLRWTPRAQAELVLRTCRALGAGRPTLVAHSWGTLVALEAALAHPDRIRGAVLISGYYYPTARGDAAAFGANAIPALGDVLRYTLSPLLGRVLAPALIRKLFAPLPVPERFRRGFPLPLALRPWQLRAVGEESAMMVPAAAALRRRYASLRTPVVVVAGASDRIVDAERHSARLSRETAAPLLLLPAVGHMAHHAAPEAILQAVDGLAP